MDVHIDLVAEDVMTADVETVDADDTVSTVLTTLARRDFSGFPVVEDGELVGVVTESDLVDIFQPSERTLWLPIGLPPFLEPVNYAIDISWDGLDTELDLARNATRPVRDVMTTEPVSVRMDTPFANIVNVLGADDPDVNRLPVVADGAVVGIITRQDVIRALRDAAAEST
jgi:CBS domain-containing protein